LTTTIANDYAGNNGNQKNTMCHLYWGHWSAGKYDSTIVWSYFPHTVHCACILLQGLWRPNTPMSLLSSWLLSCSWRAKDRSG
jgi:hypothetical protein